MDGWPDVLIKGEAEDLNDEAMVDNNFSNNFADDGRPKTRKPHVISEIRVIVHVERP